MPDLRRKPDLKRRAPRVRSARRADRDAVVGLLGLLFAQESEFRPNAALQRRALNLLLGTPSAGKILVAETGGRVVGMVSLLPSVSTALGGRVAWLEDLVVADGWRGKGVGTLLVKAAVEEAKKRGWRRISLLTDPENVGAQSLYLKNGFSASSMRTFRRILV